MWQQRPECGRSADRTADTSRVSETAPETGTRAKKALPPFHFHSPCPKTVQGGDMAGYGGPPQAWGGGYAPPAAAAYSYPGYAAPGYPAGPYGAPQAAFGQPGFPQQAPPAAQQPGPDGQPQQGDQHGNPQQPTGGAHAPAPGQQMAPGCVSSVSLKADIVTLPWTADPRCLDPRLSFTDVLPTLAPTQASCALVRLRHRGGVGGSLHCVLRPASRAGELPAGALSGDGRVRTLPSEIRTEGRELGSMMCTWGIQPPQPRKPSLRHHEFRLQ